MCLLIQDKIAMYGFSPGPFFFLFVPGLHQVSSALLWWTYNVEAMGTKPKNKRKKNTLDQSALAKLALVQRQLALKIRNKAVPLCKLFL